ncbi:unnamed protein product [Paramecium sonneborni]|uniref:Uncharacterized protein n=1 Tax=Paramecium sonneborni TaxID=65129 RepID=A0A8S1QNQ8_9CILI|nr:unnamed protein product [Paramecium sonneborni]
MQMYQMVVFLIQFQRIQIKQQQLTFNSFQCFKFHHERNKTEHQIQEDLQNFTSVGLGLKT